ncbi:MAG: peptide deformylase [Bacteroidota bacterium]|jgi:peptide deformylase
MNSRFVVLITIITLFSVKSMAQFSDREMELIYSESVETPMRVLLLENEQDSLVLRQKSTDMDRIIGNIDLGLLVERMKLTMYSKSGVGIAAPQVGISKNIFLFTQTNDPDKRVIVAINPKITKYPNQTVCFERDGCLSIPGVSGNTIRYPWIEVEYTNQNGVLIQERLDGYSRVDGFTAIVFQHEYDHLQGVLFIDKLCSEEQPR